MPLAPAGPVHPHGPVCGVTGGSVPDVVLMGQTNGAGHRRASVTSPATSAKLTQE